MSTCRCHQPPFHYSHFDRETIGIDETNGRFGDVTWEKCKNCGQQWLHYLVEYEAFSRSGRWFRGLIPPESAEKVTAQNAVTALEGLSWHFYGGSYFDSTGKRGTGPIMVDL